MQRASDALCQTIEAALLRQLLEVFVTMCVVVSDGRAFTPALRAIAARVSAPVSAARVPRVCLCLH
jgi:hypothetical protein